MVKTLFLSDLYVREVEAPRHCPINSKSMLILLGFANKLFKCYNLKIITGEGEQFHAAPRLCPIDLKSMLIFCYYSQIIGN